MLRSLLTPAAGLYGLGVRARAAAYSRGLIRVQLLNQPVVCIGNLAAGGTGKTPLVAAITRILIRRGFKPGILTRGYGRQGGQRLIALPPAPRREPDPRIVGDEPALLARALPEVPMVICADRHRGGRFAEDKFGVNIHILDDGFQHFALRRDIDVVALDAAQPFFEDALLPAGRLREPVSGLRRAHLVVLTRAASAGAQPLEQRLQAIHPALPVFQSRTELQAFLDAASGNVLDLAACQGRPVYAFCGVGNPEAFFQDLRSWGLMVNAARKFPDHHRYIYREIGQLIRDARRSGAAALMTTEKDLMNLPAGWRSDVPLLVCRIEMQMAEPERFEETLLRLLAKDRPHIPAAAAP